MGVLSLLTYAPIAHRGEGGRAKMNGMTEAEGKKDKQGVRNVI